MFMTSHASITPQRKWIHDVLAHKFLIKKVMTCNFKLIKNVHQWHNILHNVIMFKKLMLGNVRFE